MEKLGKGDASKIWREESGCGNLVGWVWWAQGFREGVVGEAVFGSLAAPANQSPYPLSLWGP